MKKLTCHPGARRAAHRRHTKRSIGRGNRGRPVSSKATVSVAAIGYPIPRAPANGIWEGRSTRVNPEQEIHPSVCCIGLKMKTNHNPTHEIHPTNCLSPYLHAILMRAKRGVVGRSQLYDTLFKEHRQNYLGKAGVGPKSSLPGTGSLMPPPLITSAPNAVKPMTRNEEADMVFQAIRLHRPQPIVEPQSDISAVRMVWAFKRRQALLNAFNGRPV
ncbi:hypothetical protein DFS34DRAFT_595219 [Phlyctochytrium arcticum]|nr:hypothetical protein DFS34DRAFT_595219 [Phlyctochytrium arcticum]